MQKIFIFIVIFIIICACKNPFGNGENSPSDFSIQNTENGKILLRLKPEVGEKTDMEMKLIIKPETGLLSVDSEVVANLIMRVAAAEDSGNIYHLDFQRFRMNTSILGKEIKYDSQSSDSNIPSGFTQDLEQMLAKKVVMQMDTLAQVKSIKFNDENQPVQSAKMDLNVLFIPLPEKEIATGESWQKEQNINVLGNANFNYTLEKISDEDVLVTLAPTDPDNGSEVSGQYLIDRKTGFTKKGELTIKDEQNKIDVRITVDSTVEN